MTDEVIDYLHASRSQVVSAVVAGKIKFLIDFIILISFARIHQLLKVMHKYMMKLILLEHSESMQQMLVKSD